MSLVSRGSRAIVDANTKEELDDIIEELHRKDVIPDLDEIFTFDLYRLKKPGMFQHWSIAHVPSASKHVPSASKYDSNQVFTIEMGKVKEDDKVVLLCQPYKGNINKHEHLSSKRCQTRELFYAAWETLCQFGKYHVLWNNCQTFTNRYLDRIQLPFKKRKLCIIQ